MSQRSLPDTLADTDGGGWAPFCDFLRVEVPDEPYPKTNARAEFFAAVKSGTEELAD